MSEELTKKQLEAQLVKFKQLYKSVADANKRWEKTNNDLMKQLQIANNNLVNAQNAVNMHKNMLVQTTEAHNKKEQGLVELLNKLKAKIREMGYHGDFDSLGN